MALPDLGEYVGELVRKRALETAAIPGQIVAGTVGAAEEAARQGRGFKRGLYGEKPRAAQRDIRLTEPGDQAAAGATAAVTGAPAADSMVRPGAFDQTGSVGLGPVDRPRSYDPTAVATQQTFRPAGVERVADRSSSGVTFSKPTEAGYGPGQSPIMAEAARKDAAAAGERAAQRDKLVNFGLEQAASASGYDSPAAYATKIRLGNLSTRALAADQNAALGQKLASAERIAGTEAGSRKFGALAGIEGHRLGAEATKYAAERGEAGHRYTAEQGLNAAITKALTDYQRHGQTNEATLEAARIRAGGGTPRVTYSPLGDEAAIARPGGAVEFSTSQQRAVQAQGNSIKAQYKAGAITREAALKKLQALGIE